MILISHPRSGSDWLLRGAPELGYSRCEIFSHLNDEQNSTFKGVPFGAKIRYLKAMRIGTACQKIHGCQLRQLVQDEPRAHELITLLRERTDLYFIKRLDMRKSIVSGWIAAANNNNYHYDPKDLTQGGNMSYKELFNLYTAHYLDTLWVEQAFDYVERFTFEGLLSGAEVPHTFVFRPALADSIKRDTYKIKHLITNIDQVQGWMDDLRIPGQLDH